MKNFYLLLLTLFCSGVCIAQTAGAPFQTFDAPYMYYSTNGKWMAGAIGETVSIMDLEKNIVKEYVNREDGTDAGHVVYYLNSINEQGIAGGWMINAYGGERAVYWTPDKEWVDLPLRPTDKRSSMCHGASSDGSVLFGNVGRAKWQPESGTEPDADDIPVIWHRNSEGGYDEYEELPRASKDFGGYAPKTMFIKSVSLDGNTAIGRFYDYSGIYGQPVVWKKDDGGKWDYKLIGTDFMTNKDAKIPAYPEHYPVEPDVFEYYTNEEGAAYNAAVKSYEDSVALAGFSVPADQRLPWPNYNPAEHKADFFDISTPEGRKRHNDYAIVFNQFLEDAKEFNETLGQFYADCDKYFKLDCLFNVIDLGMSPNGRYAISTLYAGRVCLIDLDADKVTVIEGADKYIPSCVLDDGTVFLCSPCDNLPLYRHTIVWKEETGIIPFTQWLRSISNKACDDLEQACNLVDDVLYSGVASSRDGEGKVIGGWNQNKDGSYFSWLIDLTKYDDSKFASAIETTPSEEVKIYPNPAIETIYLEGNNLEQVALFDLTGRMVYESSVCVGQIPVDHLVEGTYLLKVNAGGKIITRKVMVKK